jgi:hypothetical protein
MGAGVERIALSIEAEKHTEAIPAAVAEVNAAAARVAAIQQSNARVAERTAQQTVTAAQRETQVRRDVQNAIREDVTLLGLKARLVDVTSAGAVQAFREEATAVRAAVAEEKGQEAVLLRIDLAMKSVESRADAMAAAELRAGGAATRANQAIGGVPAGKIHSGAQAASTLAFALAGVEGNAKTTAFALGNVAQTLALMTNTVQIAAWASGIGAALTIVGSLVALMSELNKEASAPEGFLNRIEIYNRTASHGALAALDARIAAAQAAAAAGPQIQRTGSGMGTTFTFIDTLAEYNKLLKEREALAKRVVGLDEDDEHAARDRNRSLAIAVATQQQSADHELEHLRLVSAGAGQAHLAFNELLRASDERQRAIRLSFQQYDADGRVIKLTQAQIEARANLLATEKAITLERTLQVQRELNVQAAQRAAEGAGIGAGSGPANLYAEYNAKVALYEAERIAAGQNAEAQEAYELKIRKLRRDTYTQSIGYFGQLTRVMTESGSRQVRAVGHAADAIRRFLIGAESARAAVHAATEGAAAIGALAVGDFRGAALHGASSLQYAQAAALGAAEALGGGRTASGGGGGGAGGGSTFVPNDRNGGQSLVLNLYVRDRYNREDVARARYELGRAEDLKQTTPVASVGGLSISMGRA